jgi:hypothetical protein
MTRLPYGSVAATSPGTTTNFCALLSRAKPVIRKLFKKIDTTEAVGHLSEALDKSSPLIKTSETYDGRAKTNIAQTTVSG